MGRSPSRWFARLRSLLAKPVLALVRPLVAAALARERVLHRLDLLEAQFRQNDLRAQLGNSAECGRRLRELLAGIRIEDPVDGRFERVGGPADGGYVMETSTLRPDAGIAYSLGIGEDVSWDLDMADRGFEVFQYDHSIDASPTGHERFHFHRVRIGGGDPAGPVPTVTLDSLVEQNGHLRRNDLVLKMDIEGDEWAVLRTVSDETLGAFSQIVLEVHGLWRVDDEAFYAAARIALRRLFTRFAPVHVHGNNACGVVVVGGVCVPEVFELTCLRRDLVPTLPGTRFFPTALDRPNVPGRPDLYLGRFEY